MRPSARPLRFTRLYEFQPGVVLRITTDRKDVAAYFDAEYGRSAVGQCDRLALDVQVGGGAQAPVASGAPGTVVRRVRHKLTRWKTTLSGLEDETIQMTFQGRGPMALPYLQNFYLEPLLRVKLLEAGYGLVHGASLIAGDKSVLFPGGSRVGKTTLMLRHAARGLPVQGDNHVIVSAQGESYAFPRRLRVYPELRRTLPSLYRRLALRDRITLRMLAWLRTLSLGYASPASRVAIAQIVPACDIRRQAPIDSAFALSRHQGSSVMGPLPLTPDQFIDMVQAHGLSEAAWLGDLTSPYLAAHPRSRLGRTAERERAILQDALRDVRLFEIRVPTVTDAGQLASHLSLLAGLGG